MKNETEYKRGTTRGGLWLNVWGFRTDPLSIDLADGSRVAFPFDTRACQQPEQAAAPPRGYPQIEPASPARREYPRPLRGTARRVRIEMATQPSGHCNVSVSKDPVAIGATTIFPVTAVSMREVKLRDALSRTAYGEAGDRYPTRVVSPPETPSSQ